ncbi:ISNCY family transposase [Jannaschia sp.]|nr:ISNCY family transposase [Jannaschia sp.]
MGWVMMSERELRRVEVLAQLDDGGIDATSAAHVLAVSRRQVFRLLRRFREEGPSSLAHRARGRMANNRIDDAVREVALDLVREKYRDFGPTLAAETLLDRHGMSISRETLRRWMVEDGLWLTRKDRRRFHRSRLRRESFGELIQIDGSDHRWFEDRGPACMLLVFVDDATSKLLHLSFVRTESTFAYFAALEIYLAQHGRPVAFYSDKHTVFRVGRKTPKTGHGITQFGRALEELGIEIICADSSQAKGRVERANRTLQDRLVKALHLEGISDMDAGNAFLPSFVRSFNTRFAKAPFRPDDLHRPLNVGPDRLRTILCLREHRYVGAQLSFRYERNHVILDETEITRGLAGKYVETLVFADGVFEVRWNGMALSYKIFSKDQQRVTQASIVENKNLSAVLEHIKAEQEKSAPKAKRGPIQRTRYTPTGRRNDGWNSTAARIAKSKAAKAAGQSSDP